MTTNADLADTAVKEGAAGLTRTIYVASSWRNQVHAGLVELLRSHGHRVYDFKDPDGTGRNGFTWSDTGLKHSNPLTGDHRVPDLSSATDYVGCLDHPAAVAGFTNDFAAMCAADTFVLVLPCGRSAHLELGWAVGQGKRTIVWLDDPCTPELMYRMVDCIVTNADDLLTWVAGGEPRPFGSQWKRTPGGTPQTPSVGGPQ